MDAVISKESVNQQTASTAGHGSIRDSIYLTELYTLVLSPSVSNRMCTWCTWQAVVSGGLQGGPCEERLGLPRAGLGQFQPAPAAPLQGTAQPHSQDGGASGRACVSKGRKCRSRRRENQRTSR